MSVYESVGDIQKPILGYISKIDGKENSYQNGLNKNYYRQFSVQKLSLNNNNNIYIYIFFYLSEQQEDFQHTCFLI